MGEGSPIGFISTGLLESFSPLGSLPLIVFFLFGGFFNESPIGLKSFGLLGFPIPWGFPPLFFFFGILVPTGFSSVGLFISFSPLGSFPAGFFFDGTIFKLSFSPSGLLSKGLLIFGLPFGSLPGNFFLDYLLDLIHLDYLYLLIL